MEHKFIIAHRRFMANAVVLAASVFVFAGAVFFGLASCGGYGWHRDFFRVFAVVAAIVAVVVPSSALGSISGKAVFLIGLVLGFHLVEAAVAPFYPAAPDSLREYGALFLQSLNLGACR